MARASTTKKRLKWLRATLAVEVLSLMIATGATGQTGPAMPPATVEDALHEMSDAAGIIFTGQVTAIRRIPGQSGASGVVEVDFSVDKAVRGCVAGSTYTLREWAGLWADSNSRYRVGQRLLMMLHTPGPSGMSSPVGGMDGAVPLRGIESQITPSASPTASGATVSAASFTATATASVPATAAAAPIKMVDLRWVGTRVLKSANINASAGTTVSGASVTGTNSTGSSPAVDSSTSTPAQAAAIDAVIGMLNTWEQTRATR
jgi:hypothetical protein